MQSLLILGRQPELGLAELENLYGPDKISRLNGHAALLDIDPCLLAFKRLGGSLKFGKLLTTLESDKWSDVVDFLINSAPEHVQKMPAGKMNLGLSLYGFDIEVREISKSALKIKRSIQKTGRNVRLVPNKAPELNTAQVIYNKLTNERSWELLIIRNEGKIHIAQTVMIQDITAYAKRDQSRPHRDARVGMLPPKLAQIIINLSVDKLSENELKSICNNDAKSKEIVRLHQTILDPFCGSGVILQEALLMGYDIIGSDINPRMVDYSQKNIKWLSERYDIKAETDNIFIGDAKSTSWPTFNSLATEANLGLPLQQIPSASELTNIIDGVNALIETFLKNVTSQTKAGFKLCLGVPAWQVSKDSFKQLPVIDHLTDLGYNFMEFKHVDARELIYYRPDQLVARQLLTLIRK